MIFKKSDKSTIMSLLRNYAFILYFMFAMLVFSGPVVLFTAKHRGKENRFIFMPYDMQSSVVDEQYKAKYVWDYCWINYEYFMTRCSPNPNCTRIIGAEAQYSIGQKITWVIQTCDLEGNFGSHGGDIFKIFIDGPSLISPRVYDMRNGTYFTMVELVDAGSYRVNVTLRWSCCRAYTFCNVERDRFQPIHLIKEWQLEVVSNDRSFHEFGRWRRRDTILTKEIHPLLDGPYVWQGNAEKDPLKDPFPMTKLKKKWVAFIGDSLMQHSFEYFTETVLPSLTPTTPDILIVNRNNGSVMPRRWVGHGMEVHYFRDLDFTISFSYYPDKYPVAGYQDTRFPLINETTRESTGMLDVGTNFTRWFEFIREAMHSHKTIPSYNAPDIIIFNFGLHFANQLDPPYYHIYLRHLLLLLQREFHPKQTKLIWRGTAYTHFPTRDLPSFWMCRAPVRTEILNEISEEIMTAANIPIVDMKDLTASRPDATPDNRHYLRGNVRATFISILLNYLDRTT